MAEADAETQVVPTENGDDQVAEVFPCSKWGNPCFDQPGSIEKAGTWTCASCTNIYQMIYRHLGGSEGTLQSLSAKKQKEFFKNNAALIAAVPRNGRWALVKAGLIKEVATFRTQQMTVRVSSEFKPLSVWAKEGYDVSKIESKGEKRENPVLGEVWAAPSTAVAHEDIRGQVEKRDQPERVWVKSCEEGEKKSSY